MLSLVPVLFNVGGCQTVVLICCAHLSDELYLLFRAEFERGLGFNPDFLDITGCEEYIHSCSTFLIANRLAGA